MAENSAARVAATNCLQARRTASARNVCCNKGCRAWPPAPPQAAIPGPRPTPVTPPSLPPAAVHRRPRSRIGPYKLLEQIGEGGMGVVYMAEQEKPVRRRVALKIIKPGMDTGQVIARFEAERQALALMDHPNIARVLDAGATDIRPALTS